MFWTIVGAILFVFVGIPVILSLLGLGVWLLIAVVKLIAGKTSEIAQGGSPIKKLLGYLYNHKFAVLITGVVLVTSIVVIISQSNNSSTPTIINYDYSNYQSKYEEEQENRRQLLIAEQARKQELVKQQYEDVIANITKDNPDKRISWDDESYIRANIPTSVNYFTLKDRLLELGFNFIGYESKVYGNE